MGLFKKEKKTEEPQMVRTKDTRAFDEDDDMEPQVDDDLEDEEPEPEFKPRGRPAMAKPQPPARPEPVEQEPKVVEVAVNLELINNKLNYLITQNNEIINRLKR